MKNFKKFSFLLSFSFPSLNNQGYNRMFWVRTRMLGVQGMGFGVKCRVLAQLCSPQEGCLTSGSLLLIRKVGRLRIAFRLLL